MKKSYLTVTDQFCGAGGSSLGAAAAGAEIRLALNHWKLAIETHNTNFPDTDHDCTDLSACDPRRYPSTDILITSPECTNHSLAKGKQRKYQAQMEMFGKASIDPSEERSRATMWDVPRFAEFHNYRLIIVENVVDARHWRLFDAWLQAMALLDYNHETVYFNSMFAHPTPQSRDRMYVVFWKKGNKAPNLRFMPPAYCPRCERNVAAVQSWKNPAKKWGRYGKNRQYLYLCPACAGQVQPYYYCAANAIDWSLPSERIGDRKRPLKEKTLDRIQVGLEKYGRQPFMVAPGGRQKGESRAIWHAFSTQTGTPTFGLVSPFLVDLGHTHAQHPGKLHGIADALPTQTTGQTLAMVVPLDYTDKEGRLLDEPFPTQTARQSLAFVVSMRDTPDYPLKHVTEPLPTQSTVGAPYLVELYGKSDVRSMDEPISSILTTPHHGLVMPYLVELHGTATAGPVTDPLGCVLAGGNHHALVQPQPFIMSYYSRDDAQQPLDKPLGTVTAEPRHALVQPQPFLVSYYGGSDVIKPTTDPVGTVSTHDRHGLVQPEPKLDDCYFRMLKSHEIGKAMAFPQTYRVLGNERDRVRQYGNAVTPPVMAMLLERCIETFK